MRKQIGCTATLTHTILQDNTKVIWYYQCQGWQSSKPIYCKHTSSKNGSSSVLKVDRL